jgi:hypothetical protein
LLIITVGGGLAPNLGLLVETWGDQQTRQDVASDDGPVVLAVDVTDLGGGMWRYEYAFYNWLSDRMVHQFSIPVGGASISGVGFHDVDKNAGNDWVATVEGGHVTWATDDWLANKNANALEYQSLFNFRFDADVPPVPGQAQCLIYKPGIGTSFSVDTQVPDGGAVAAGDLRADAPALALRAADPNPFASSTRLSFSLPRPGDARLSVVDVSGRTVRVLVDGPSPAGGRDVVWDGRDASGGAVASGVYLLRLETEDGVRTTKVARLR